MVYDCRMNKAQHECRVEVEQGSIEARRRRRPGAFLVAGSLLWLLCATGCDLFDLDTTRLVAGSVIHSPAIDAPGGSLPELTFASVFFGEREAGVDVFVFPPVGVVGADVQLTIFAPGDSVRDVPLTGLDDGNYVSSSENDPNLTYQAGASYRVEVSELDDFFEVDVEHAPAPEAPQGAPGTHTIGEPITVSRSQMRIAFIEVLRLEGGAVFETFSNRPTTHQEVLRVIADPSSYQASSFEIPGDAFQQAGHYAIVLTTAVRGVPDFNLYSGSGVLVGAGEARVIQVE